MTGLSIDSRGITTVFGIPATNRDRKGKSLLALENDYVVIDLETTGLTPSFDEILELGAIRFRGDREVGRFQSLVKPLEPISSFIAELTGITDEMVSDAPEIGDVLPHFLSFIGDDLLVGHNINFDVNFIYDYAVSCHLTPCSNNFVDTLRMARRVYRNLNNHKLSTLCDYLCIPQPIEHRAIADCLRTQACYVCMKNAVASGLADLRSESERYSSMAQRIEAQGDHQNPDSPLYGKYVAFTGTLQRMKRKDAMQATADIGGICCDGVTQQTNFLVLGNNDYCKSIKGGKSSKQKKAEKLQLSGYDIQVISEEAFYEMLETE